MHHSNESTSRALPLEGLLEHDLELPPPAGIPADPKDSACSQASQIVAVAVHNASLCIIDSILEDTKILAQFSQFTRLRRHGAPVFSLISPDEFCGSRCDPNPHIS